MEDAGLEVPNLDFLYHSLSPIWLIPPIIMDAKQCSGSVLRLGNPDLMLIVVSFLSGCMTCAAV